MPYLKKITTKAKAKEWLVINGLISSNGDVWHEALFSALDYDCTLSATKRTIEKLKLRIGTDFVFTKTESETGKKSVHCYMFSKQAAIKIIWAESKKPRNRIYPDPDEQPTTAVAVVNESPSRQLMSSLEIADLTRKKHGHVLRDIDTMIDELKEDNPRLDYLKKHGLTVCTDNFTKRRTQILLDRLHTECLLTGYSAVVRMRVIKRWQELESENAQSPALIESQKLISEMKPKVDYVDSFMSANGNYRIREVARILEVGEKQFIDWMLKQKVMYRLNKRLAAYQNHVDAGRFVTKVGVSKFKNAYQSSLFTPKGLAWITELWNS